MLGDVGGELDSVVEGALHRGRGHQSGAIRQGRASLVLTLTLSPLILILIVI